MKLYTKAIEKITPKIGSQPEVSTENIKFYFKLFAPWNNWTWYVAECDFETGECFGLVVGFENELGYFDLKELEAIKGPIGLKIERDLSFEPTGYYDIMKQESKSG